MKELFKKLWADLKKGQKVNITNFDDYFKQNAFHDCCHCKEIVCDESVNNVNDLINKKEEQNNGTK